MSETLASEPAGRSVSVPEPQLDTQTWTGPGVATLGVPFHVKALAAGVLKTVGSKWDLAADTS